MTKLVCSTSKYSVGCTFLDWSINYLHGKSKFLNRKHGWLDVVDDPVDVSTAHKHQKNHPNGLNQTMEYVDFLQKNSDFATLYPVSLTADVAANIIDQPLLNTNDSAWQKILDYADQDYNQMLHWLDNKDAKIIYVSTNKSLPLYVNCEFRSIDRAMHTDKKPASVTDIREGKNQVFFQKSIDTWKMLDLDTTWDRRERMALDLRPFEMLNENVDFSFDHYWIDCVDMWFNGDKKIIEIMSWLDIKIDTSKHDQWLRVYHKWRHIQAQSMKFQLEFNHIIECIVKGWSYPIDLTFDQEIAVQHYLIYKHNLNLKTWLLEKFPNNTKHLHLLLEPNIHTVEKLY